jgi:hypothetical protein
MSEEGQSVVEFHRIAVCGVQAFADRLPLLAVKSCAWLLSAPQCVFLRPRDLKTVSNSASSATSDLRLALDVDLLERACPSKIVNPK